MGFRAWWRWKSHNPGGRPGIDQEPRDLVRRMCEENPLWGAPRIHGELLKLGFEVAQSTVSKYMLEDFSPQPRRRDCIRGFPHRSDAGIRTTVRVCHLDGAYGEAFTRRLRAMGIRDRPIAPRSPWQNGYVERWIGSIRRECLDHVIIWGEAHLRHVLKAYTAYYNATRISELTRTLQIVGQSRGAARS